MSKNRNRKAPQKRSSTISPQQIARVLELINSEGIACNGYHSLDQDPTIVTACKGLASLVGLVSWHLMSNSESGGDIRIKNELSRKIDISPNQYMTRQNFYESIAMNLLLYGDGNAVVRPHRKWLSTRSGNHSCIAFFIPAGSTVSNL